MDLLVAVALAIAVVSAVRGVWSPCGLSMLSSITPMTEAGRGHRFGSTAAWFTFGGVLGGLSIGLLGAGAAALVAVADLSDASLWGIGAVLALATASIDLGIAGIELPIFKRQVNDEWLREYRSWVYGAGFGWQIGFGVATYIMTAGVLLTIALSVLSGSPIAAITIGTTFGLVRGCAVWIARGATTPAALGHVHDRLDALGPASKAAAVAVQVAAAAVLATAAFGPVAGGAAVVVSGVVLAVRRNTQRPAAA